MVRELTAERPGALELSVEVDGGLRPAIAYPALVGPVRPGDRVLVNTTAVTLHLGTGGTDFVVAVLGADALEVEGPGHVMKLRYSPAQAAVLSVEEPDSPHREAIEAADGLDGTPVVWTPLHSLVAPVVAGARAAGAQRVAYVMTDGAALGAPLSRACAALRSSGLLEAVVSAGQAFGGDLESVNTFTGLLAARVVAGADVVVVGDGPGNTGTGTRWGATDLWSAMSLSAARILGGTAVAALRISFADPRARHRVVSHHSLTALARVVEPGAHVAIPAPVGHARERAIRDALAGASVAERHRLVEADGRPAIELLASRGIALESMGRTVQDDPVFFLAGGAAGRTGRATPAW